MVCQILSPTSSTPGGQTDGEPIAKKLSRTIGKMSCSMMWEIPKYVDVEYASISIPMRVWQMAGLCSVSVRQATVQNWMMLGVYYTRVFLHKIKKVKTPICAGCNSKDEDLSHLLLHCRFYDPIREKYLSQYFVQNTSIGDILGNEDLFIQTLLDPISVRVTKTVCNSWLSVKDAK